MDDCCHKICFQVFYEQSELELTERYETLQQGLIRQVTCIITAAMMHSNCPAAVKVSCMNRHMKQIATSWQASMPFCFSHSPTRHVGCTIQMQVQVMLAMTECSDLYMQQDERLGYVDI